MVNKKIQIHSNVFNQYAPYPMNANRIPKFDGDVAKWATAMHKDGLSYHIDDNSIDIIDVTTKKKTFTRDECVKLDEILIPWSMDMRELYFATVIELLHQEKETVLL